MPAGLLRLMPQKIPIIGAARTFSPNGVCEVKNRQIGGFFGFYVRSVTNSRHGNSIQYPENLSRKRPGVFSAQGIERESFFYCRE
jgi:hypothetical protein